ncbi:MAG: general secretion pathway protein GspB [bacterium]
MSTILDALRKLEEDKRRARQGRDPLQMTLEPVSADQGKGPLRRRRAAWLGTAALVLALLALGGTAYWRSVRQEPSARVEEPGEKAVRTEEPARAQAAADDEGEGLPVLSPETAPPPSALPEGPQMRAAAGPAETPYRQIPALPPTATSPGDQAREEEPAGGPLASLSPVDHPPEAWPGAEEEPPPPDEPEGAEEEPEAYEPAAPVEETVPGETEEDLAVEGEPRRATAIEERGIRISAVVWSVEPANRFAVINLRTLHEGDQIDGKLVDEIQEDGVVFQQGGERYKIRLGRR